MSVQSRLAVPQRTAVYRFFDDNDRLLYVGITNDTKTRFAHHARQKADTWWPKAVRHTVTWFDDRAEAAQAEVTAIENEESLHNLSSKPAPTLVSTSAAVHLSVDDLNDCEWVTPSEIARRVVSLGMRKSFTRTRVMQIAQSDPEWPVPRDQWRSIANMWLFPWPPVEDYFRNGKSRQGQRPPSPPAAE